MTAVLFGSPCWEYGRDRTYRGVRYILRQRVTRIGKPLAFIESTSPVDSLNLSIQQQTIAFIDPSALPDNPGWPLRNLLAYIRALHPSSTHLRILSWRDSELPTANGTWKSRFGVLSVGAAAADEGAKTKPSAVGWEKNVQGKLGPRVADLAPMMDPTR